MYEKILDILNKETITKAEEDFLEEMISKDPDINKFVIVFKNVKRVVENSAHIDLNFMAEYILHQNNLPLENNHLVKLFPKIENHLRSCPVCSDSYKQLTAEYSSIDKHLEKAINIDNESIGQQAEGKISHSLFKSYFGVARLAFTSVVVISMLYLGLFLASNIFTPSYKNLASFSDDTDFFTNRSLKSETFQKSLTEIENENYNAAIILLEEEVNKNLNNGSLFYLHYLLGLTYIKSAENDFIGLFESYDKINVEKGITHLLSAIDKNQSGKFMNITLNAYFYIGKAHLLIDKVPEGKNYLQLVVENKGSHIKEAEALIRSLENL